ncbi:efflux RND transporter periplasmic adaptor subunit [Geofilum rubicundum]|uniref:Probable Co/Zn/Cd efflux system membrane fusion protein n=1 Tax=Geofilum rubicundum JCM 15548 TaxID=1236989 RepID=A0A0E9LYW9_9BACT|nr:efflux RND transporter periplasmic adaptor subunit [Geofilum rubicundum]GAO30483.1 probable Co/Zn/Cd efflux system membrane fusion protein [Geofilum rubicundum JCM 15548]
MKARHENTESMLCTARAQMTAARNQLDYTLLSAPFSGVISTVLVRENEMIGSGMPVAIVASANDPEVATAVPESIIGRIVQGDQVRVHLASPKATALTGVVSEISPGNARLSAYPVVIRLNDSGDHLLPGMTCTVIFSLAEEGSERDNAVLTVAADAVGKDHSGHFVYLAAKTDAPDIYSAVKRAVTVGQLKPDGYEILDGVAAGDLVITAGLSFLHDGKEVKLMKDE